MSDLGDLLGSLMSGLIRARRMADEQTAALAEYYKTNPLLEGLSVPRVRIPELTIDMPFLIENYVAGEVGQIADPTKIAEAAVAQVKTTLTRNNIKIGNTFNKSFTDEIKKQLGTIQESGTPIVREVVARSVQSAFANSLAKSKSELTDSEKEIIAKELRSGVAAIAIAKEPVRSSLNANIETADVKEKATPTSVVRLKITLKEEGLEWTTQASEAGGVKNTLQPE